MAGNLAETAHANILRILGERQRQNNKADTRPRTRLALATQAGIPQSNVYRKLKDRPDTLTLLDVGNIAEALGVTVEDLLRPVEEGDDGDDGEAA